MASYYNEIDPFAAAWLRELITAGLIADGEVDERSIEVVTADDVRGFTQCHWFAGIGGWSYALRLAGWPDDRAVWTGSCPCQPFSSAGKGDGEVDPRDLWPAWVRLIRECQPHVVFGEQVEAAARGGWLDRLSADLEGEGYAVGACVLGAHSVGAFHLRQRLWFVADTERGSAERRGYDVGATERRPEGGAQERQRLRADARAGGEFSRVADAEYPERWPLRGPVEDERDGQDAGRAEAHGQFGACSAVLNMADAEAVRQRQGRADASRCDEGTGSQGARIGSADYRSGFWADAVWIPCRDGKARPTQPEIFPLASGIQNRVGLLRGAGNSIVPQVAQAFIESYMEARGLT
jgi:DNA (cytosine-5)-methyltransferase 1